MSHAPTPVLYVSRHADVAEAEDMDLLDLAGRLDRRRWTPLMLLPGAGTMAAQCKQRDIQTFVLRMSACGWISRALRDGVTRLREIIRVTDASVLHVEGARAMMYAGPAGRLEGRRVVWHVRAAEPGGLTDRVLVHLAHRIVVDSQAVAEALPYLPKDRVFCVHTGLDLEAYDPPLPTKAHAVRRQLGVPVNSPVAMTIARFTTEQGYRDVLEAARRLAATKPELHWILVGAGEQRRTIEACCQDNGLEGRLHFFGPTSGISGLLAACDFFVLPVLPAGLARVLIEAMAMGKPVVATKTAGVSEAVVPGETGILVPPGDPEALVQAVRGLIANPNLAEFFGRNGRSLVERRFTFSQRLQSINNMYDALVA